MAYLFYCVMGVPVVFSCVGEAQQPTTGRFRQSRRRICRAEIRRTEGVEASALCREKRNTQDNDYYIMHDLERATPHSAQGSSRCRHVEGPLAEQLELRVLPRRPSALAGSAALMSLMSRFV